ncbi:hypothetical protein FHS85_000522 [Rhodoligotrophos appendicifer]|uniref:hypothetical protein n=1 Tax=Rhodoligotrophos appendicifer TaxID=987056 RepID=UPI00117FD75E|nr:hypothetical protein [Rhodoligotrophos appendicifer]
MAPVTRLICALALLTAAGLCLCAFLIYGSLDRSQVQVAESNLKFVLTQLRDSIEANVNLGLALPEIRIAQDLIEQAQAADSEILAVEIFSPNGTSQFNTDRGSIGEPVRESWNEAIRRSLGYGRWRVEEFGDIVVGEVIRNDFGEPVGHVAITLAGSSRELHADAVGSILTSRMAIALPCAVLVVIFSAWALLRAATAPLRDVRSHLSSTSPVAATSGLGLLADEARAAVATRVVELDRTVSAILALDEDKEQDAAA